MKKKILSLGIVAILILMLVLLTGCGNKEKVEYNNESNNKDSLASVVKVGDYVEYSVIENSYTLKSDKSGINKDQEFVTDESVKWRVLSIEDDGSINLISEDGIGTKYDKEIQLDGKVAYDNVVEELNNICKIYEDGKFASSARSMTMEDFNKLLDVNSVVEYYENEFESDVGGRTTEEKFTNIYKLINEYYGTEIKVGNETHTLNTGYFDWKSDKGLAYGFANQITNQTYLDLLKNNKTIFLANQVIDYSISPNKENISVEYNVGSYFYGTNVASYNSGENLYIEYAKADGGIYKTSEDTNHSYTKGYIRPIITLNNNVANAGGTGTSSDPYIIK